VLFTDPTFIFLFLPALLGIHFVLPRSLKNTWLAFGSIVFYALDGVHYTYILLASIGFNYLFGLFADSGRTDRVRRGALTLAVCFNISVLLACKYSNFIFASLPFSPDALGLPSQQGTELDLPLGISFYTFQAISYVVDVHRGITRAQRNPLNLALYISLFPQLIAGPIVRYREIAEQIAERTIRRKDFEIGIRRFVIGLGKKLLIANTVAQVADAVFTLPADDLTPALAWLGLACYTLQIYFDFSGYSDMAIGLGRMFGFRIPENFNHPYAATSVTEFWRRWHMTLSRWFRDYLYIPMGGNRGSRNRTYFNLLMVFFLCGLWHGASWSFVVWGLIHGSLITLERMGFGRILKRLPVPVQYSYTLLAVMFGWVYFRAEDIGHAKLFVATLAGLNPSLSEAMDPADFVSNDMLLAMAIGILFSFPILPWIRKCWAGLIREAEDRAHRSRILIIGRYGSELVLMILLIVSLSAIAANAYNPFIYFRF
jgi:alginate O-acetyltransferase complex protein AlgI